MVVRRKFENQKMRIKMPSIQTKYRDVSLKPQNQLKSIIKYTLELKLFYSRGSL